MGCFDLAESAGSQVQDVEVDLEGWQVHRPEEGWVDLLGRDSVAGWVDQDFVGLR